MIDRRAAAAAGITIVLWASAFVGIRDAGVAFSPGAIAFGRLLVGTLALGLLLARRGWQPLTRAAALLVIASGVLWFGFYNLALNQAERSVDAGTASMLVNTGPIFLGIFAGVFLREGLPGRLIAGLAVAFTGTIVIGIATPGGDFGLETPVVGIALCIFCAVAYAGGVTLQKPALRTISAIQVTWLACATGAVVCLPFAPALLDELGHAEPGRAAWIAYLGLAPTAIGFTTWAYALSRTSAGRLGVTTYLVPPVVIAMAWLLLGEVPPALALLGGAACVAGVVVARTPSLRWRRTASATTG